MVILPFIETQLAVSELAREHTITVGPVSMLYAMCHVIDDIFNEVGHTTDEPAPGEPDPEFAAKVEAALADIAPWVRIAILSGILESFCRACGFPTETFARTCEWAIKMSEVTRN